VRAAPCRLRCIVAAERGRRGGAGRGPAVGSRLARPFLSVSRLVNASGEEQGLLSMAFAPDYAQSGPFYLDYTGANGNLHIVQCRHTGNSNVAGGRAPGPC
jgi:hypothetical protein